MRTTTTKQVTSTYTTITVTCDLCGREGRSSEDKCGDWNKESYGVSETGLFCEQGSNYGTDGYQTKVTAFDVCHVCFFAKVVPALEALGLKAQNVKRSW